MKKLILILVAVCAVFGAILSVRAEGPSVTVLGMGAHEWSHAGDSWVYWNDRNWDSGDRYLSRIGLVEVGFNGLREMPDAYGIYSGGEKFMDLDMGRSLGWTFNVVNLGTRISRDNTLGVSAALGLKVDDYVFRTPNRMGVFNDRIVAIATGEDLKKSKLNTVAIHIPVTLDLNLSRNFFVSAGVYADLMIGSHFKSKFPKEKLRQTYTNFGQFGATARVGWRDFYLFGNYGLTDLIDRDHGPEVRPFSFGVGLGF